MAFAALNCLNEAIRFLQNSSHASESILSCPGIKFVQYKVDTFQKLLERTPRFLSREDEQVLGDLDRQAQVLVYQLRDEIENNLGGTLKKITVVREAIDSILPRVSRIKGIFATTLKQVIRGMNQRSDISPRTDLDSITSKMIGLDDNFTRLRDRLVFNQGASCLVYSIFGMAGIGKTALAKRLYQDPLIKDHFQLCAIVSIGPKYEFKQVIQVLLAQMMGRHSDIDRTNSVEVLSLSMRRHLEGKRYLIVLDDVWDRDFMPKFTSLCLPNSEYGCRIIVTTRILGVARDLRISDIPYRMRFLNEEEGWNLILEKVFGNERCPPDLWTIGRKIVENCDGLPLTIIGVAELLSKAEKTVEYWESVAEDPNPLSIGVDGQSEITQSLLLSYKHLPQYLKPCFLYLAVFLHKSGSHLSQLANLWSAEGLLGPNVLVMDYLQELRFSNLVLESKSAVNVLNNSLERAYHFDKLHLPQMVSHNGLITNFPITVKIHSAYWHICVSEARKNKLFRILNTLASTEDLCTENQRRLCIQNNVLFGIKEARDSVASLTNNMHSLLCTGPHHNYPIPICFGRLRMLRVLDALTIHFYVFPMEVVKLILLRYLALTYDGILPASISRLWNLQFFIVHRRFSIKSTETRSYLPVEIWDLKELRHLQAIGRDLPDPPPGSSLPNLIVLLDVSPLSCTPQVLEGIPGLETLGIEMDLAPSVVDSVPLFNNLACLSKLLSLKCIVTNPHNSRLHSVALPPSCKMLPESLLELTLSGLGYDWKYITAIGELPNLEILTLQCNAFRGYKWITSRKHFRRLRILTLEDMDLEQWEGEPGCFTNLYSLTVMHCYKLECIPPLAQQNSIFASMFLTDCQPSVVLSTLEMLRRYCWARALANHGNAMSVTLLVLVFSSWNNQFQFMNSKTDFQEFDVEKYVAER